jgi:hypothetical protein
VIIEDIQCAGRSRCQISSDNRERIIEKIIEDIHKNEGAIGPFVLWFMAW